jgi:hypothetical protein
VDVRAEARRSVRVEVDVAIDDDRLELAADERQHTEDERQLAFEERAGPVRQHGRHRDGAFLAGKWVGPAPGQDAGHHRAAPLVVGVDDGDGARLGVSRGPEWRPRKEAYLARLAQEGEHILLVSTADKLDKARAIVADLRKDGPGVWSRFTGGTESLWYSSPALEEPGTYRRPRVARLASVHASR